MRTKGFSADRILVVVILLALFVRWGLAIVLGDAAEPISGAYDQISYDTLAERLITGHGLTFAVNSYPAIPAETPTAFWSFGYTLYLAVVYLVFGHHPLVARLIQALFSGLSIWLTYRLARRLFDEIVALVAVALTATYAYLIFFNVTLMTQTFYIIALLAALELALALAGNSRPTSGTRNRELITWTALGLTLGIGALMRQTLLLFAPFLIAYIWWARSKHNAARANQPTSLSTGHAGPLAAARRLLITGIVTSVLVVAVFVLPWTIRNYLVYNDFLLLNSNSGFWFYFSNHPDQGTNFNPNYVAAIPNDLKALPEPALDRALLREAVRLVLSDPVRFMFLSINRTKDYFWLAPSEQSSLISNVSRLLSFTLYLPFMVYGLYLSRKNWRACLPLYLYAAFDTGLCLVSWSAPRYRLPTDALMMVFAGLAVTTLAERLGVLRWLAERFPVQNPRSGI